MIDKDSLEIGTEIYYKVLRQKGVFDETCFTLERMNESKTSIFVSFEGEPKEVLIELCEVIEFEEPKLCQSCFSHLKENEYNICTSCALILHNKLGG